MGTYETDLNLPNIHTGAYLFVNPAILGKGVSIFTKMEDMLLLKPVSAKVYPCGITVLVYLARQ